MKHPPCPTPTRMECAREFRGIELEKMCADLGIDPRAYEKWEEVEDDGSEGVYDYEIPPSRELMQEVAFYLQFPIEWFYMPEIELLDESHISWVSGSQSLDQELERAAMKAEERLK